MTDSGFETNGGFGDSALYTTTDDSGTRTSLFEPANGPFMLQPLAPSADPHCSFSGLAKGAGAVPGKYYFLCGKRLGRSKR